MILATSGSSSTMAMILVVSMLILKVYFTAGGAKNAEEGRGRPRPCRFPACVSVSLRFCGESFAHVLVPASPAAELGQIPADEGLQPVRADPLAPSASVSSV